ncbi:MAG: DUF3017 domain-containing protein [Actinobacteria bacterium]|nr:DUF3017 domain-containing protein [Actinomycetota bacterium]MSW24071.1 DUF3017 domain-containing protein [Actinomycetota bacterium]MSX29766.1 DUF3017 domain-containing protein [Actinomycetota bacterium]MSX97701.1 DUF3017 domain-containing protein [Actinomycetota bacterium]MSY52896.1 DUF3017 domain-containing protein [Actinomycetota bacterium]
MSRCISLAPDIFSTNQGGHERPTPSTNQWQDGQVMKTSLRRQWPIITVYLGMIVALAFVVFVDFRFGAILLALSVLLAFVLRLRLTDAQAGMLRIRRRRVDLTLLATLGTLLLILAIVVPHGSK